MCLETHVRVEGPHPSILVSHMTRQFSSKEERKNRAMLGDVKDWCGMKAWKTSDLGHYVLGRQGKEHERLGKQVVCKGMGFAENQTGINTAKHSTHNIVHTAQHTQHTQHNTHTKQHSIAQDCTA